MKNESGRSMVEMLGVLAIIGILSAGALKGYSDAMFKYKMNQTIDITTKMLQRFEEINQKDWGGTQDENVNIYTGDGSAVAWGLLDKCDSDGHDGCRLPIGSVYIDLYDSPSDSNECGAPGHYGQFDFYFTSGKECIAFASVHWEQMLPDEWFNSRRGFDIGGTYLYFPYPTDDNSVTFSTTSDIINNCQTKCNNQNTCRVTLIYRAYAC